MHLAASRSSALLVAALEGKIPVVDPEAVEMAWYSWWEECGFFKPRRPEGENQGKNMPRISFFLFGVGLKAKDSKEFHTTIKKKHQLLIFGDFPPWLPMMIQ